MKIGITYDIREDYTLGGDDWTHADFSSMDGVLYIKRLLEKKGHTVVLIGNFHKLYNYVKSGKIRTIDIVFNTAEGIRSRNREGWIPSLLEATGIPYVGTDAYGSSLTLDKIQTKVICEHLKIPTPAYHEINGTEDIRDALASVGCPCVLKPNTEGTSSGVELIRNPRDFARRAEILLGKYGPSILCEQYIEGREVTVPIIGNGKDTKAIGIVETVRRNGFPLGIYSLHDKESDACTKVLPDLDDITRERLMKYSVQLHNYIGCADYNRADYRMDEEGKLYFLELNALPDMAEDGSYSMCCELLGIPFEDVLDQIVCGAWERLSAQQSSVMSSQTVTAAKDRPRRRSSL